MPPRELDRDEVLLCIRAGKEWAERAYQTVSLRLGSQLAELLAKGDERAAAFWPFFPTARDGAAILEPYYAEGRIRREASPMPRASLIAYRAAAAHYDLLCVTAQPPAPPSSPTR